MANRWFIPNPAAWLLFKKVWGYGSVGVWEKKTLPHSQPPTHPYINKSTGFGIKRAVVLVLLWAWVPLVALAQECLDDPEQAQNALEQAQRLYRLEFFIEAVQLLAPCVPMLDKPSKSEALRLMAIAHYEAGEPDSSRLWVRQLVRRVDRRYRVDPAEDPLFFQDLVRQLRPKWYQKRWVQFSGGLVVSGVLGYVLFRPEDRPPGPLAGPPVFPSQ